MFSFWEHLEYGGAAVFVRGHLLPLGNFTANLSLRPDHQHTPVCLQHSHRQSLAQPHTHNTITYVSAAGKISQVDVRRQTAQEV